MKTFVHLDTIGDAHKMLGLPAPQHPLISLLPIDQRVAEFDYGDATYVFGFYQISLKSGISGNIAYGRNGYDFTEGSMIFSKPGQAFQFKDNEIQEGTEGWTLLFSPDLIVKSPLARSINSYSFFSYDVNEALHLSVQERKTLTELVEKIVQEYTQRIDRHSQKLIVSNIELILDYCTRYYDRQFFMRSNLNQDAISKLETLLQTYFDEERCLDDGIPSVKFCAEHLNMSPDYLSDLLKKETGQSAQHHIQSFVIERAKTQLLNSNQQISQIAYGLGFEYPQHFSKLFKAKTGVAPAEYRKLH